MSREKPADTKKHQVLTQTLKLETLDTLLESNVRPKHLRIHRKVQPGVKTSKLK